MSISFEPKNEDPFKLDDNFMLKLSLTLARTIYRISI